MTIAVANVRALPLRTPPRPRGDSPLAHSSPPPHAQLTFIGVRLLLRRDTVGTAQYALLALTTAMYAVCYSGIAGALGAHPPPVPPAAAALALLPGVLEYISPDCSRPASLQRRTTAPPGS